MAKKRKNAKARARRRKSQARNAPKAYIEAPDGRALELVEFDIVYDPMPEPYRKKLTRQECADLDWMSLQLLSDPQRCIEFLEPLLQKHPDFPKIYNHLTVAYLEVGREAEALALMRETYRRFPKYLFGRINYAMECLREGRVEEIPTIFENKFSLHLLYPERRGRFHVSEFVQFNAVMGLYLSRIGKREIAERYLDMIKDLDPDHPLVHVLDRELNSGWLGRLLGRR